ncbi:MAG: hypothetical protein KC646_14630 [Candidatus Cloacimonetes bacterium]|nr:hypothetical protein [Candidatus Cloacimonadota bacterium]
MSKFLLIFCIVILAFANLGCFTKKAPKKVAPIVSTVDEDDLEVVDEPIEEEITNSDSGFRTLEEKWDDFKYKTSYKTKDEMIFFAEDIFHQIPSKDIEKKMQLSFYLMEAYQKRKDNDNAKKYAEHYKNFFKLKTGGKAFQKHQSMIDFKEKLSEKWGPSEE